MKKIRLHLVKNLRISESKFYIEFFILRKKTEFIEELINELLIYKK